MKTNQPYTAGDWIVKPGQEEAFIAAWGELAEWSNESVPGAGQPYLIQEVANPQHFISFGPWESPEAVRDWRSRPEFKEKLAKVAGLCEQFQGKDYILRFTIESEDE